MMPATNGQDAGAYARPGSSCLLPAAVFDKAAPAEPRGLTIEAALAFIVDLPTKLTPGAIAGAIRCVRPALVLHDGDSHQPVRVMIGGNARSLNDVPLALNGFVLEHNGREVLHGATAAGYSHPLDGAEVAAAQMAASGKQGPAVLVVGGFHEPSEAADGLYELRMKHLGPVYLRVGDRA